MNTLASHAWSVILAEASDWFIEFRAGEVNADARARFDEWLRRSPQHIQAYLEIASAWSELPTADPEGRLNLAELIGHARASANESVVSIATGRATDLGQRRQRRFKAGIAAALGALAIAVGFAAWTALHHGDTYSTGIGEQRMVRLADGSVVELNARSAIRVRLSGDERDVELAEGQASFHVAKDPTRPFAVRSGTTTVRAVGTQFDVYNRPDGTVVTVLEGRVAVAESGSRWPILGRAGGNAPSVGRSRRADGTPIYLSAGEQVTVTGNGALHARKADVASATAWMQRRLIFDETPLAEVAAEFNRYNARRLVIADPNLGSVAVSGVYSTTDPDALIGFLQAQPMIVLTETEDEIQVGRRRAN